MSNSLYYANHLDEILRITESDALTLMDYGCSYPEFLIQCQNNPKINGIGIEFDLNYVKLGRKLGITIFDPSEIGQIKNLSIDFVRFSHVLEHLIDPKNTLRNVNKKIKRGGWIYVTQPNFPQIDFSNCVNLLKDAVFPEHLHFFTPVSLVHILEELEFEIIKFFTHTTDAQVIKQYSEYELQTACYENVKGISENTGDSFFSRWENFPYYFGSNSSLWARKK